ncbi:MAG: sugar transferase [Bacteroidota bacterium]
MRNWMMDISHWMGRLGALLILVVGLPLWGVTLLYSWLRWREWPIFIQVRTGKEGVPLVIRKVKTLNGSAESGDNREELTWMRSSGLDEWPQLLEIVRGKMAWIGPRPLPLRYLSVMTPLEKQRLAVLPGLIGLVQVMGRNTLRWEQKFRLDRWYIQHHSWRLDLEIGIRATRQLMRRVFYFRDQHNPHSPDLEQLRYAPLLKTNG